MIYDIMKLSIWLATTIQLLIELNMFIMQMEKVKEIQNSEQNKQKSNLIWEYVVFLYFDLNFYNYNEAKVSIIKKLKNYNETDTKKQIKKFQESF